MTELDNAAMAEDVAGIQQGLLLLRNKFVKLVSDLDATLATLERTKGELALKTQECDSLRSEIAVLRSNR